MPHLTDPERICDQILEAVGHQAPPTDLNAVCSLWPDLRVAKENLDKEGYLVPLGVHGAEILLRNHDSPTRQKFTLAHELGHWTKAHLKSGQVCLGSSTHPIMSFQTDHKRQTPEEIWCNRFAACLLMPRKDVYRYFRGSKSRNLADRISKGHSLFQVSQEAFFGRVASITPVNIFEIVVIDSNAKIRRSFPSRYLKDDQAKETMNRLLHFFMDTHDPFDGFLSIENHRVDSKMTYSSSYTSTWLISITPVDSVE